MISFFFFLLFGTPVFPDFSQIHMLMNNAVSTVTFSDVENKPTFQVEIADTEAKREEGLMFRKEMAQDKGMLFIFQDDLPRSFWMKNTLIPLDMIFVDAKGKVVAIQYDAEPCNVPVCSIYGSGVAARYVVELNAGVTDLKHIVVGSTMDIGRF